jgi:hypothetical protein
VTYNKGWERKGKGRKKEKKTSYCFSCGLNAYKETEIMIFHTQKSWLIPYRIYNAEV